MSKRNNKKPRIVDVVNTASTVDAPATFGFEEMLSELEAIVVQAQERQAEEAEAA